MYPEVTLHGHSNSFISFFGTPVRASYREVKRRRVSPTSLKVSEHHRAIWDLRCFRSARIAAPNSDGAGRLG